MAVPPRGDPRRPLHLAVRSCRVLGVLALLCATCALAPLFVGRRGGGPMSVVATVLSLGLYGSVGTAFLVLAQYAQRRQFWAVVAALSLAGVVLLFAAMGAIVMAVMVLAGVFRTPTPTPAPMTAILWGSVAVEALVAVALGQVVYWLARSIAALHLPPWPDDGRGFDVLPVAVLPTGPEGQA